MILPRNEPNAAARQAEIEAIDSEIVGLLARLSTLIEQVGQKLWVDKWPENRRCSASFSSGNTWRRKSGSSESTGCMIRFSSSRRDFSSTAASCVSRFWR